MKNAWGTMTSAVDASVAGTSPLSKRPAKSKAEKMSKMEEEGTAKWTEEQLAETMLEFSGTAMVVGDQTKCVGKMLMVGWKATKLEVIQVTR